jgi:hypothetical protein
MIMRKLTSDNLVKRETNIMKDCKCIVVRHCYKQSLNKIMPPKSYHCDKCGKNYSDPNNWAACSFEIFKGNDLINS